ncbi:hypothetical protein AB0L75_05070 [Streptomyces sp. NPDC052101]|uniref:hypothetical protein n=1 Tax=Streptomyces sp. NPDC052101 TaxID=3155763 RepID=UPI003425F1B9
MESPAENKRTALLALGVLGVLLVAVLTVFTVFSGNDGGSGTEGRGRAVPAASADAGGSNGGSSSQQPAAAATPIVPLPEVAKAHQVMASYMAGLNTYDHTSGASAWSKPLLGLTTGDTQMQQNTTLPKGKAWADCLAQRCSSKGTAAVVRDTVIADDVVRNSGRSISSLVRVTAAYTANGKTSTQSNDWLVTVKDDSGDWVVSGFNVFGLGDVGASDQSGE